MRVQTPKFTSSSVVLMVIPRKLNSPNPVQFHFNKGGKSRVLLWCDTIGFIWPDMIGSKCVVVYLRVRVRFCCGVTRHSLVWYSMVWNAMVLYHSPWYGVWYGVWYCMVCGCIACAVLCALLLCGVVWRGVVLCRIVSYRMVYMAANVVNPFYLLRTDAFRIHVGELGDIRSVRIRQDNSKVSPNWFLAAVSEL